MRTPRWAPPLVAALIAASSAACSPDPAPAPQGASPAVVNPSAAVGRPRPPGNGAAAAANPAAAPPTTMAPSIERLAELEDPFQPSVAEAATPPRDDRPRKSGRYAIEQLKLVAVVQAGHEPRAMMVDPRGRGWVLRQGDLVGRAEPVRAAGEERRASWRVDRIRARDVVLVREGDPDEVVRTRVIELPPDPIALDEDDEMAVYTQQ